MNYGEQPYNPGAITQNMSVNMIVFGGWRVERLMNIDPAKFL